MKSDLSYLRSLMGNDDIRTNQFLDIYKTEVPELMNRLQHAIDTGDLEAISTTAHGIKSQSAYLMAEDVVILARELENNAENAAPMTILREITSQLVAEVQALLKSL